MTGMDASYSKIVGGQHPALDVPKPSNKDRKNGTVLGKSGATPFGTNHSVPDFPASTLLARMAK